MRKKLIFLGIETSCDETAASVVQERNDGTGKILSNIVSSQVKEHKKFGGVVPDIAARAHVEKIDFIIKEAIKKSNIKIVTSGCACRKPDCSSASATKNDTNAPAIYTSP